MRGSTESQNVAVPMHDSVAEEAPQKSVRNYETPNSAVQNVAIDVRCELDVREQRYLAILEEFEREMEIAARKATAVVIGRFQQRIERERLETRDRFASIRREFEAAA